MWIIEGQNWPSLRLETCNEFKRQSWILPGVLPGEIVQLFMKSKVGIDPRGSQKWFRRVKENDREMQGTASKRTGDERAKNEVSLVNTQTDYSRVEIIHIALKPVFD